MAGRHYEWSRNFYHTVTPTTSFHQTLGPLEPGATVIAQYLEFSLEGEISTGSDPFPWFGQQTIFGVITQFGATQPAEPDPSVDLDMDWQWWGQVQWRADAFLQEPSTAVVTYRGQSPDQGIKIKSKRGPVPAGQGGWITARFINTTSSDSNFEFLYTMAWSVLLEVPD